MQGASLAASEHSGSISGEHLGGSGDAYEPPSSPFDALFGKVGFYCFPLKSDQASSGTLPAPVRCILFPT